MVCVLMVTMKDGQEVTYVGENMVKALGSLLACQRERDIVTISVVFRDKTHEDSFDLHFPKFAKRR